MDKEMEGHLHSQWSIDIDPGFKSSELISKACCSSTLYAYIHKEGQTDTALFAFWFWIFCDE